MKIEIDNLSSVSKFRNETASILSAIKETHSPVILTQRGHPSFVLEEIDTYRQKTERLEVLEDIFASLQEIEKGETIPNDEVMADLEKRLQEYQ
ncbi:MAG: type II toxin-antitoxin system Phd/YefM family antitoxin [bacterium]|nr:type II toxin-antitoxin system Phd/YefM family antitoxin [bacterium]